MNAKEGNFLPADRVDTGGGGGCCCGWGGGGEAA